MSRAKIRVSELAIEARMSDDDVLLALLDLGLPISKATDYIPRRQLSLARKTIGLPATPDRLTVAELSTSFKIPEEEVRRILVTKRIIAKDAVSIPNSLAKLAEATVRSEQKALRERLRIQELAKLQEEAKRRRKQEKKEREKRKKEQDEWPTIGHPAESLSFLSAGDIEAIHWELVRDFGQSRDPIEPPGVRNEAILDSAVFRPHTAMGLTLKYPTVVMAAAALFHSLVHDHCFHNGNKRTAVVSLLVFLDRNGYILNISEEELFDLVLRVGRHAVLEDESGPGKDYADRETLAITWWLQGRIKRVAKGELCVKFRQLRQILTSYGCSFPEMGRGFIDIYRDGRRVQVWYGGEGRDVELNTVHKIRHELELDEEHGYDSDIFYNASNRIPSFINKYRKTLDRLAKL